MLALDEVLIRKHGEWLRAALDPDDADPMEPDYRALASEPVTSQTMDSADSAEGPSIQ